MGVNVLKSRRQQMKMQRKKKENLDILLVSEKSSYSHSSIFFDLDFGISAGVFFNRKNGQSSNNCRCSGNAAL